MKIYDREGGPHPARIRIVLAEKRLEARIEFTSVDLIGAEQKQSAFLAIAPELAALAAWHSRVSDIPCVKNRSGQAPLPEDLARLGG